MKYIAVVVIALFIYACGENTRHSIGINTSPLSSKMEEKTKLNYKITFGKIRPKEDED